MKTIGHVENSVELRKDHSWGTEISSILLEDAYRGGLLGLGEFSHAIILYHLDKAQFDRELHLQRRPQNRADMPLTGFFPSAPRTDPTRSA